MCIKTVVLLILSMRLFKQSAELSQANNGNKFLQKFNGDNDE